MDKTALLLLMMMMMRPTSVLGNLAVKVGDDVSYQHTFDTLSTDSRLVSAKRMARNMHQIFSALERGYVAEGVKERANA